jgi:NitT/TauT family transport system ATP-binding protein
MQPRVLLMDEAFSALDVLTGERLRDDILELWEGGQMPTRGILVVSHNIQEAVMMADRVLIFASDPGRVRAELPIDLPRPRNADSMEVRRLVDEVYALMTVSAGRPGRTAEPARHMGERLPDADVSRMEGVLELLAGESFHGRADLPRLVEESDLTDDELLTAASALHLLGFAVMAHGDIALTPLARNFVHGSNTLRHELFGQQVLSQVPLAAHIRHSLEQEPSGELPEGLFLKLLREHMEPAEAERVLKVAIEWGRYGEVFEYNYNTGLIHLPDGSDDAAAKA